MLLLSCLVSHPKRINMYLCASIRHITMKNQFSKLLFLLVLGIACACGDDQVAMAATENAEELPSEELTYTDPVPVKLTTRQQGLVGELNDFSFKLFVNLLEAQVAKEEGQTLMASPLSVAYVLGMLAEGGTEQVRSEINTALGFPNASHDEVNAFFGNLMTNAPLTDRTVTLTQAGSLFLNNRFTPKKAYQKTIAKYYAATCERLDFSSSAALERINGWCNEQTRGLIPSILQNLDPQAAACLLNAIYFKARWQDEFLESRTQERDFTTSDSTVIRLPLMASKRKMRYAETSECQAVWLPYGNGSFDMAILLPKEGTDALTLAGQLSSDFLTDLLERRTLEEVDFQMPRFTTASEMNLIKAMKAMGIQSLFVPSASCTLPGICNESDLLVSDMLQKSRIEVTEKGTEAAAVTAVVMVNSAMPMQQDIKVFHAIRPFIYLIRENSSKAIFFIGLYDGKSS